MPAVLQLDTFKQMLSIDLNDLDYDNVLTMILDSVEKYVETDLKVILTQKDITIKVIGNNSADMFLYNRPLVSINSVVEIYLPTFTKVDITSEVKILDEEFSIIFRINKFSSVCQYIINGTFGYSTPPEDLIYAMYQLALKMYSLIDTQKSGVDKITTPDGTISYSYELLNSGVREIFDKYKVVSW